MPQLSCIFCQRTPPLVKITKEHVFSRWVDTVLTPELLGPGRSFERTMGDSGGVTEARSWPSEVVATIEARVVCGSQQDGDHDGCNDGWMSDLDGQVKHIISPMMLGHSAAITPDQQLTIATWAAVKTMVFEYTWGEQQPVVSAQQDRDHVFHERRPPESMQIRIAAVESHGRPALATRRVYRLDPRFGPSAGEPLFAFCVTFVLGCFVVQTFGGPGLIPGVAPRGPVPDNADFVRICPSDARNVSWPPPQVLDDEALDRFTHPLQPVTGD